MPSELTSDEVRSLHRSNSVSSSRFGTKSHSMFFSRNVAHPRNLRFITGVAGSQICSIKEDQFTLPKQYLSSSASFLADPHFSLSYQPNYDQAMIKAYANRLKPKRMKERLLPPISFWSSYGVISDDTNRWREELNHLASSVGLMTSDEVKSATERLQKEKNMMNLPASPIKRKTSQSVEPGQRPMTSEYSRETGRLNETPKPRTSRSSRGGPRMPEYVFCVDNGEREMWMIQVLCQILQTDSMQDVQSWLISAGPSEKEAARELIQKALQGLQESGRIEMETNPINNNKEIQVDLEQIQETIQRISNTQQQQRAAILPETTLNTIKENEEVLTARNNSNENNEVAKVNERRATPAPPPAVLTPLERLLTASQNYDRNPKTAAVINDTKYALLPSKEDTTDPRPFTADLFKTKKDTKADRKLSTKIIKELVSFVEVERQSKKSPTREKTAEKAQLFPARSSSSAKIRVSKNNEKDSQVLTIED